MALSAAMQWALANGMSQADVYKNINDFLATNPTAAQTQAQMAQYGISPEDVAAATGGASGGLLSGNIMAGASWNSTNTALQNALTQATGQQTSNYAVGGSTTTDTLNQLNKFLAGGGQFDPNATVYLQAGGVDFITGVDKAVVKDNLNQIVKTLGDQGVNVVLTGSPYAASIDDVINNKFDPKVDQIYTDIAKENKNVALVGTQGEILQNKALLVDALHTNAEGTAIYNQSVIDALSQFKNEVPASTPQAIAQAQQTNTVATTPSVITQAASNPAVAQTLAASTNQNPLVKLYQDTLGRTPTQAEIDKWNFGDTIDAGELDRFLGSARNEATSTLPTTGTAANLAKQILAQGTSSQWTGQGYGSAEKNAYDMGVMLAGQGITDINQLGQGTKVIPASEQQVEGGDGFTTVVTPERTVSTFVNKATGQEINPYYDKAASIGPNIWGGTFAGKDSTAYGVKFDAAGNPILYSQYGGDSSDLAQYAPLIKMAVMAATAGGAGGALGGSLLGEGASQIATNALGNAIIGGTTSGILGGDPLKGALLGGAGGALGGYLQGANAAVLGDASDIAMSMADSGASLSEIQNALTSQGFSADVVAESLKDAANVLTPTATNIPSTSVNVPDTVSIASAATTPTLANLINTISTVPTALTNAGTVNVTGVNKPQQIDNEVLNLINSQLASNVSTPANLANVQVTGQTPVTNQDVVNSIIASLPTTTPVAQQTITAQKPTTVQDVVNTITATLPTVTPTQAATIAEQVIASNKPTTTQDIVNAVTSVLPTTTQVTPTQTITAQKPATVQEVVNAITSTLPSVTTTQAQNIAEQVITSNKPVTTQDVVNAITTALPTNTAVTTSTTPTQTITAEKPITTQDVINTIIAAVPTTTTTVPTTTITAEKPSSITNAVTAATIPLIQPTTPLTPTEVKAETPLSTSDKLRIAQIGLTTAGLLTAGSAAANSGSGATQYPVVPVPEEWTSPIKTGVASTSPITSLKPIDFGNRNLLIGTQWEKFLDPNYGKVPEPIQYSQPSNLSYNDLMSILGSKQGMPPASTLSINDIISGIQNQYGQKSRSTMG